MIIIAREELSRAAAGFIKPRNDGQHPPSRLTAAGHQQDNNPQENPYTKTAAGDLYRNRLWRCE